MLHEGDDLHATTAAVAVEDVDLEGSLEEFVRQERQVHIDGLARLAPTKHRETTDEAKLPAFGQAERLQIGGGLDDFVHGRRDRLKRRCCSTSPEVGLGARGAT